MHKHQGWPQAWEYSQAKLIQTLGRASQGVNWSWSQCIKSHHAQTSSGKGLPSHFWTRDNIRSVLPVLWRKRTGLLLSGPKSSFQMKVHFISRSRVWRVERHRIHVAWSPVWSFHSQWWFGLPCHLLVLVQCFLKSTVNAAIYQEIFSSTSCFLLLTSFMEMLISFSSRTWHLPTLPKVPKSWFNDHGVTVLDWSANSPDLNPIENLWGIVKRKMRDTRPNNADDLKATIKATWASIPPQQCHKLITSMPRRIEAVIKAKGAPTKYWVHIQ